MALGDRACRIDADEEEGDALGTGPLQGREAVGHLFERGAEAVGEALEVVAGLLGGGEKPFVGHERRASEIVGKAHLGDGSRLGRMETGKIERRLEKLVLRQKRDLQEELKGPRLLGRAAREGEDLRLGIVVARHIRVGKAHRHAPRAERGNGGITDVGARALGREPLGGAIHRVDVVVAIVEEVAHLLPRARLQPRILAPERLVERSQPLVRLPVGAVQIEEGAGKGGGIGGRKPQIGKARWRVAENRVGQRLAHIAHKARLVARLQFGHVKAKLLREA